jgi:hypothetical protein
VDLHVRHYDVLHDILADGARLADELPAAVHAAGVVAAGLEERLAGDAGAHEARHRCPHAAAPAFSRSRPPGPGPPGRAM